MDLLRTVGGYAGKMRAIEDRPCFRVSSSDSGRSSVVDLTSVADPSVVVDVETIATSGHSVADMIHEDCDCTHNDRGGSHLHCDYLVLICTGLSSTLVYIEVKTGMSNEQRDVAHGFRQVMCSKSIFESILEGCSRVTEPGESFGVVVSPAFALSEENQRWSSVWGITNGIRLILVKSGDDVWSECAAS